MGRALRDGGRTGDQIEFLEPRDLAFGGDRPADFAGIDLDEIPEPDDTEPRSRWLAGAAGVAVVAMIAVGVVAAAPWDTSGGSGGNQTSPTTTPAAAPTTAATPSTVPPTSAVVTTDEPVGPSGGGAAGYVFDPLPDGLSVTGAWDAFGSPMTPRGWSEVWATPGATHATGRWFSATLGDGVTGYALPASRIDVGGRVGLLSQRPDGVLELIAEVADGAATRSLSVQSFGMTQAELVALTAAAIVDPATSGDGARIAFTDLGVVDGFVQLAAQRSDQDLVSLFLGPSYGRSTSYADTTGDRQIGVWAAALDDALPQLAAIALGPAQLDGPLVIPGSLSGATDLTLGSLSGYSDEPYAFARWSDGDVTITVVATLPMDELVSLLPTLRATTPREWSVVQRRVEDQAPPDDAIGSPAGRTYDLGSGNVESGASWHVTFQAPEWVTVGVPTMGTSFPLHIVDRAEITSFQGFTIVTASLGLDSPVTSMRVTVGGEVVGEAPVTPLAEIDAAIMYPAKVGVLAFDQLGTFQVDLLDASGAVVDQVLSPGAGG